MSCRKRIDSKLWLDYTQTMETEVRTLKQELANTQEALKAATKRCRDLVRELDNRKASHESERALRDQQLSRILRALLVLEARLKQEQKSIRQLLCEKDNVIRNQQLEIARLRRYTKNYIKCKRDQTLGKSSMSNEITASIEKTLFEKSVSPKKAIDLSEEDESSLSKDIQNLKCEIITKLNPPEESVDLEELDRGIKKTHSFAESDISKTSLTSSENTDVSIITTTTEGSPSLLSTEGFCEGESTDVSPGSTLNKSSRCTPTTVTDSENETTMIFDDEDDDELTIGGAKSSKRRTGMGGKMKTQKALRGGEEMAKIVRTESKDDGMDCNFLSDDDNDDDDEEEEDKAREPIYVNACNESNAKNLVETETATTPATASRTNEDYSNNNNANPKIDMEDQTVEETSGNWYSDPDEDRLNDDVFRHSSYRPNSNHNSVLECVNQILLRDMEEEESSIVSMPRRFKHRGRIVRFQPARLSDIESVGSEMERKNSDDGALEKENASAENLSEVGNGSFEATASEDEFGMRIERPVSAKVDPKSSEPESALEEPESREPKAIPIVIIEPKVVDVEEARNVAFTTPVMPTTRTKASSIQTINPPLKMERIEEKTCLQMSTKGLTIAKNLDYEDIESLPEVISPPPKTPPALPPKPQFRNNTLILKKIPSPSFLIDETRKKLQLLDTTGTSEHGKKIFGLLSSPVKSTAAVVRSARSLSFDDPPIRATENGNEESNFWRNRFNNVRSSFQTRQSSESAAEQSRKAPRVTNIVRQFEEFKIGGETEDPSRERNKAKERIAEFEEDFDIRQNFEEFNLDECDLSDDPDRPEGDGSERLSNLGAAIGQNENTVVVAKDNNNVVVAPSAANNSSSGYDHFLEATGLSNKSILTPSRLLSNHKSMLKPKDVKYKNKIKATAVLEKHGISTSGTTTHVRHWTGPFV